MRSEIRPMQHQVLERRLFLEESALDRNGQAQVPRHTWSGAAASGEELASVRTRMLSWVLRTAAAGGQQPAALVTERQTF